MAAENEVDPNVAATDPENVVDTPQATEVESPLPQPEQAPEEAPVPVPPRHIPVAEYYGADVREELRNEPWNFQFFQTVRLLERFGTGKPVGRFDNPEEEAVRFSCNPALRFPPSENHSLEWPKDGGQPRLSVNIMGLTGQLGVLPIPYTEWVNDRLRARDHTLQAFFDLFHHRLLSLFYQAWEKYRFPVGYERDQNDRFTRYLLDFIGLGSRGLRHRLSVPDEAASFYTALFGLQTRSATALRQVLQDYFAVPVEIEQFVGTWRPIAESDQTRTGDEREYSEQLSLGAIAGDEVWDQQCTARIVLGPLTLQQYLDFLPNGSAFQPLRDLTDFFSRNEIDFELQLILRRDQTPGMLLRDEKPPQPPPPDEEPCGLMLGWTTWLKNAPMTRDPAETVLQLQ